MTMNRDALGRSPLAQVRKPLWPFCALLAGIAGLGLTAIFWREELRAALIPVALVTLCVIAISWGAGRVME